MRTRQRLLIPLLLLSTALHAGGPLLIDDFEHGRAARWEEKSFRGATVYTVLPEEGGHVLHAQSKGTASGLFYKTSYELRDYPILAWRWKVANVIPGADESRKSGDDFAARVYVVFPHWFFPRTKTLCYVWGNRLAKGAAATSPFTKNAMIVAVESGAEGVGTWRAERRNVLEDYRRLFGEEPLPVGAIALMTDTDNTGAAAEAWYDDLRIEQGGN